MLRSFRQFQKGLASKKYCSMVIKINPELAKQMLKLNTQNRQYRDTRSEALAQDMRDGCWARTGESITFRSDRVVLSGQHRLEAIIKSGTTQQFVVVFNTDKSAPMYEGMGVRFTPNDHLARNGFKHLAIDFNGGAIIKHMRYAFDNPRAGMKAPEVITLAKKYEEEVSFSHECFKNIRTPRIAIAPVLAVVARAIHCHPHKKSDIKRFCSVLRDGMSLDESGNPTVVQNRDHLAVVLRDALLQQRNHKGADICHTYRKAETALYRYIHNIELNAHISPTRDELFPIAEDEAPQSGNPAETRYFVVPSKVLRCSALSVDIKKMVSRQCLPLKSKKMTRVMRPDDKVCVLGFDKLGWMARLTGSIKKVNANGNEVNISLKDGKVIKGPVVSSIWSSLNMLKKNKMPVSVFASSIRILEERDYQRLVTQ